MEDTVDIPFSKDSILKENIYMHFSRTYIRLMRNVYLNNPLTSEIKQLYPFILIRFIMRLLNYRKILIYNSVKMKLPFDDSFSIFY